ncbi:MAG: DUF481 domain-containing protein, partial [bacterium]
MRKLRPLFLLIILIFVCISYASGNDKNAYEIIGRKIALGSQFSSGNTNVQSFHADFLLNRNRQWIDELTFKGSYDQEASSGSYTMLKSALNMRYAFTFNEIYYNFYNMDIEHDHFRDIAVRIIPTIGLGVWLADTQDFQFLAEGALGYQKDSLSSSVVEESMVLQVRSFIKAKVFTRSE